MAHSVLDKEPQDIVEHQGVRLDRRAGRVFANGRELELTPTEYRLLEMLLREPGRTCSRSELMDIAIAGQAIVIQRTIDVHICALRRKLGVPRLIETVRGIGYRIRPATVSGLS